jgi:hypothetical protein
LHALREERKKESKKRKEKERDHRHCRAKEGGRRRLDANQNEWESSASGVPHPNRRSPINSIRIGIESSSDEGENDSLDAADLLESEK